MKENEGISCQVKCHVMSCQEKWDHVLLREVNSWVHVMSREVKSCHVKRSEFMSCQEKWNHVMSREVKSCHVKRIEVKGNQVKWSEAKWSKEWCDCLVPYFKLAIEVSFLISIWFHTPAYRIQTISYSSKFHSKNFTTAWSILFWNQKNDVTSLVKVNREYSHVARYSPYKIWPGLWRHFYGFKIA